MDDAGISHKELLTIFGGGFLAILGYLVGLTKWVGGIFLRDHVKLREFERVVDNQEDVRERLAVLEDRIFGGRRGHHDRRENDGG